MAIPAPVSSAYCVPYVAIFEVDYARGQFPCGKHKSTIKDAQGTVKFDVDIQNRFGMHAHRLVCDPAGNVLVLVRSKAAISYGISSFSFDIYLVSNQTSSPDFVVAGDYKNYNYDILFNGSPVAEVRKKQKKSWKILGKNHAHLVTIFPGVDHAFIASVVAIMDKLKEDSDSANSRQVLETSVEAIQNFGPGGGSCGGG